MVTGGRKHPFMLQDTLYPPFGKKQEGISPKYRLFFRAVFGELSIPVFFSLRPPEGLYKPGRSVVY